jgi:hypothetical protein
MNRIIRQGIYRLNEMGVRVLHDTVADVFHLSEMYHRENIGSYPRAEFLYTWCGEDAPIGTVFADSIFAEHR